MSIFGHFRIVFSNLFGLPGFDSANGRESWAGMHHPPPGSTETGVLPGPRDIACQTRCPLMLILGHRRLGLNHDAEEREVRKKKEERRKKPRKNHFAGTRNRTHRLMRLLLTSRVFYPLDHGATPDYEVRYVRLLDINYPTARFKPASDH